MVIPFSKTYTIKRFGTFTESGGTYINPTPTQLQINASVQPISEKERLTLPEGSRERGEIVIYSDEELKTSDQENRTAADIIVYKGLEYEIFRIDNWSDYNLPHFKSIGLKIERNRDNRKSSGL